MYTTYITTIMSLITLFRPKYCVYMRWSLFKKLPKSHPDRILRVDVYKVTVTRVNDHIRWLTVLWKVTIGIHTGSLLSMYPSPLQSKVFLWIHRLDAYRSVCWSVRLVICSISREEQSTRRTHLQVWIIPHTSHSAPTKTRMYVHISHNLL